MILIWHMDCSLLTQMKTILIPLDLGVHTLSLLDYTVPMAAQANATLLLFHVIRRQPYDNGTFEPKTEVHQRMKQEAEIILNQLSRQTLERGVRSRVLVQDGSCNPAEAIVQCAKNIRADMIVMPRARGSDSCTSEKVLQSAPCPVLAWTNGAPAHARRSIA